MMRALLFVVALAGGSAHAGHCMRSEPVPMFAADGAGIAAHAFHARSDHEADEHFRLAGGIAVDVRHGGCEDYVATLRFSGAQVDPAHAYAAAAAQLRALARLRPQSSLDFDAAAATLAALARRRPPPFGSEHAAGDPARQMGVKVDGAGSTGGQRWVRVTLFVGPL